MNTKQKIILGEIMDEMRVRYSDDKDKIFILNITRHSLEKMVRKLGWEFGGIELMEVLK